MQTLYSEYNRAVRGQKRPPVAVSSSFPSGQDYLLTYIIGLREGREMFLTECLFQEELMNDPQMSQVNSFLAGTLSAETTKSYELRFEELSHGKTAETLFREFHEHMRSMNRIIFKQLREKHKKDLPKLQELLQLGKKYSLI